MTYLGRMSGGEAGSRQGCESRPVVHRDVQPGVFISGLKF